MVRRLQFVCLLSAISLKVGCGRLRGSGGGREAARGGEDGGGRSGRSGCKNDSVSSAAARPLRLRCQRPGMYSSPLCLTQVRTPRPLGPCPHPGSSWNRNFADWNLPSAAGVEKKGARVFLTHPLPGQDVPGMDLGCGQLLRWGIPSPLSLDVHLKPRILDPHFDLNCLTVLGTLPSFPSWLDVWGSWRPPHSPHPLPPGSLGSSPDGETKWVSAESPSHPWDRSWGSMLYSWVQ